MEFESLALAILFFTAALLYASVGHAGASGYLAIMALMNIDPSLMKPTALALNIIVALIATVTFYRVNAFSTKLFIPLAIASIPCAFIGGLMTIPGYIYKPLIGCALLYSTWRFFATANIPATLPERDIPRKYLLLMGALLGFLSGISGVGGGIFLSPLLLFLRAAQPKIISGIAAAFILVNSIAGLLGVFSKGVYLSPSFSYWAIAVMIGGYIGAEIGSKKMGNPAILKMLGVVLLLAGIKMLATAF
jgi:uncharacterized protein